MDTLRGALREYCGLLQDLSDDLTVLDALVALDAASALNKIRAITQRVLRGLCAAHAVAWSATGSHGPVREPTLENMLGPLRKAKVIPPPVALHFRVIQHLGSPGSHGQDF